jgi:hypothetical protein
MPSHNRIRAALFVIVFMLGAFASHPLSAADSFDKPLRKAVVNLGRSQYLMPNNRDQIQISCFYYPGFMVKQRVDPGLKGTAWVTMDPILNAHIPACHPSHTSTERFIAKDGWFFIGAKGTLLFFEAPDGTSGGMPFRILDRKTEKKIFEDFEDTVWGKALFEFASGPDGNSKISYQRLVETNCSIPKDGISCWNKLREQYGLTIATVPKCMGYRQEGEKQWVLGDEGVPPEEITTPSAIAYPVEVGLFPAPSMKAASGPVQCFPVD